MTDIVRCRSETELNDIARVSANTHPEALSLQATGGILCACAVANIFRTVARGYAH